MSFDYEGGLDFYPPNRLRVYLCDGSWHNSAVGEAHVSTGHLTFQARGQWGLQTCELLVFSFFMALDFASFLCYFC